MEDELWEDVFHQMYAYTARRKFGQLFELFVLGRDMTMA
jgi:hypothetical protein